MRRRRPEQVLQRAVCQYLQVRPARGLFWFAVPNGGVRSPIEARILQGQGVRAGVPDLIAIKDGAVFGLAVC